MGGEAGEDLEVEPRKHKNEDRCELELAEGSVKVVEWIQWTTSYCKHLGSS